MANERSRRAAQALALAWGGWWTFFGLASGIGEGSGPVGVLVHTLVPGGVFLATAILACRRQRLGAVLLLLEALAAAAYAAPGRPYSSFLLLTLALPPLVAGLLLLAGDPGARAA